MIDLSICIPTYNRSVYLENCLNSIKLANKTSNLQVEVCVSDNCSKESIEPIIRRYDKDINIKYNKNSKNMGMGKNILKAVSMAKGEFCWLLGNDDLVLPDTFKKISNLFREFKEIDFYYINSFHLSAERFNNFKHPIDTKILNYKDFKKFSNHERSGKLNFFELIDPQKSFEFMLSIFLCIFRREYWVKNLHVVRKDLIDDSNQYSNLDNTAPHSKIWAKGFKDKKAYFSSEPLSINVHGPRSKDWGNLYPFIEGVRIPQILDNFRKEGLPVLQYLKCKNYALRRLIPSFFYMIKNRDTSNLKYVNLRKDFFYNLIYPMVYISLLIIVYKKLINLIKNLIEKK